MNIFEIIGAILLIVLAVLLVLLVMFQSPKGDGLSGLAGGSDSYFGRNSDRTIDAVLAEALVYPENHNSSREELTVAFAPPAEAALQASFADQSHFNRLFKPLIGLPPGQYQAAFQAGKEQT